jgi:hypothetical protein
LNPYALRDQRKPLENIGRTTVADCISHAVDRNQNTCSFQYFHHIQSVNSCLPLGTVLLVGRGTCQQHNRSCTSSIPIPTQPSVVGRQPYLTDPGFSVHVRSFTALRSVLGSCPVVDSSSITTANHKRCSKVCPMGMDGPLHLDCTLPVLDRRNEWQTGPHDVPFRVLMLYCLSG